MGYISLAVIGRTESLWKQFEYNLVNISVLISIKYLTISLFMKMKSIGIIVITKSVNVLGKYSFKVGFIMLNNVIDAQVSSILSGFIINSFFFRKPITKRTKAIRASMKNHSTVFWIPIVKSIGRSKLNYIK